MSPLRVIAFPGIVCLTVSCTAGSRSNARLPSTAAASSVQNLVSYYDVTGVTSAEIHSALLRTRPTINDVAVFAITEWQISWKLRTTTRLRQCRLERPDVKLVIRTTLPRWKSEADAPKELRSSWRTFALAISIHEEGHRDLGLRAVAAVADALRRAQHQHASSCTQLTSDADAAAQSVLSQFYKLNAEYDERTLHGGTQGVLWPPIPVRGTESADAPTQP